MSLPPTEAAPAEITTPVAPDGADQPQADVVPESVSRLMKNLFSEDHPETPPEKKPEPPPPEKKETPKPDGKQPAKPAAPAAPAAAAPAAAPDGGAMRLRQPKPPRIQLPVIPATPPPPAPAAKYKPDPVWERTLGETEREMLKDAMEYEERLPEKHAGLVEKTVAFLKQHSDLAAKPDYDPDSPEYKTWLERNQPRVSTEDMREIEQLRNLDAVHKKYGTELSDVRHELFGFQNESRIEKWGNDLYADMTYNSVPDDLVALVKEKGFEEAKKTHWMELDTAIQMLEAAKADFVELERISTVDPKTNRALQDVIEDPRHPKFAQHERLAQMVTRVDQQFNKTATPEQKYRDGKHYITREGFRKIPDHQKHLYWKLTNREAMELERKNLKADIAKTIAMKHDYLTKMGYSRPAPKAPPPASSIKPQPPPVPTNNPRIPAATPAPDPANPAEVEDARAKRLAATLNQ